MRTLNKSFKAYKLLWYGPFHSIEEVEEWQRKEDIDCCLYLIQGKEPYAKKYKYYCGQTTRRIVAKRFKDKDHHINEIPNRRSIWIGTFEHRYNDDDRNLVEKMFIYLISILTQEEQCINKQCLYFPEQEKDVFIVNKWKNPKRNSQPEYSVKNILPDVITYFADDDEVKVARKLHIID